MWSMQRDYSAGGFARRAAVANVSGVQCVRASALVGALIATGTRQRIEERFVRDREGETGSRA
jgi:hypothetical protein